MATARQCPAPAEPLSIEPRPLAQPIQPTGRCYHCGAPLAEFWNELPYERQFYCADGECGDFHTT